MNTIDKINRTECCGCAACFNICPVDAINMKKIKGFFYPVIDKSKCILCGKCITVCNCIEKKEKTYDKLPPKAFLYTSKNRKIISETTSGGFFTQLVTDIINEGGTAFSPAFDKNWNLRFITVASLNMIHKIRGSKYVEAYVGKIFQEVERKLIKKEKVLFSGTPCQISGLKTYLKSKQINFKDNLILVAVVCHGNVSSDYFQRFINYISHGKKIKSINFREKTYGYSTSTFAVKFTNGTSYHESYDNGYYMPAFFSGYSIRKNCFNCKFRGGETDADFIIGDYWKPTKEDLGQTVIFAYSNYAVSYINKLTKLTPGLLKTVSVEDAVLWNGNGDKSQSCLLLSPAENEQREDFIKDALKLDLNVIRKKYFPITIKKRIKAILRPVRYRIKRRLEKR